MKRPQNPQSFGLLVIHNINPAAIRRTSKPNPHKPEGLLRFFEARKLNQTMLTFKD